MNFLTLPRAKSAFGLQSYKFRLYRFIARIPVLNSQIFDSRIFRRQFSHRRMKLVSSHQGCGLPNTTPAFFGNDERFGCPRIYFVNAKAGWGSSSGNARFRIRQMTRPTDAAEFKRACLLSWNRTTEPYIFDKIRRMIAGWLRKSDRK